METGIISAPIPASLVGRVDSFEEYEKFKENTKAIEQLAQKIIHLHNLPHASLRLFSEGTNIVFAYGDHSVIKIFPPFHLNQFTSERLVLSHLEGKISVETPKLESSGEIEGWPYLIMSQLKGVLLETLWEEMSHSNKAVILQELGALIQEVHALPTNGLEAIDCHWGQFIEKQRKQCQAQHRAENLPESLIEEIPTYLQSAQLPQIKRPVLLTGEYTPMNFLVKQVEGVWHIAGLIDFGDAMLGLAQYDLLGPGAFLVQGDKALLKTFLIAYGYKSEMLTPQLSRQLMALLLLHQYSNLNLQVRIKNWQDKVKHLQDLEKWVWGCLSSNTNETPS